VNEKVQAEGSKNQRLFGAMAGLTVYAERPYPSSEFC